MYKGNSHQSIERTGNDKGRISVEVHGGNIVHVAI